jgi:hypothetical protein
MEPYQREFLRENGYLIVDGVLGAAAVDKLNRIFEQRLTAELGGARQSALAWYLNTSDEDVAPGDEGTGRVLWDNALVCPPKVEPVLRELFSDPSWGLIDPVPAAERGRFRLDHDNAHYLAPFDPHHSPDHPEVDFPTHLDPAGRNGARRWSAEHGVLSGGFHAGAPARPGRPAVIAPHPPRCAFIENPHRNERMRTDTR